jgi:hypothetical protein
MDGIDLGGMAADPRADRGDIADAAENLALLADAAVLAAEGLLATDGGKAVGAMLHLLQLLRTDAEGLAALTATCRSVRP